MFRHPIIPSIAGLALALVAGTATAQTGSSLASGPTPYSTGNRFMVGPAIPAGNYFPGSGYSAVNRSFQLQNATSQPTYGAYGPYTPPSSYFAAGTPYTFAPLSNYPGIFMTSINYPGVYGGYTYGITPAEYSYRSAPQFQIGSSAVATPVLTNTTPQYNTLSAAQGPGAGTPAFIDVQVPATASLFFESVRTQQTGARRQFVSPPLPDGREFVYKVRATWTEDDQEIIKERTVRVHAGDRLNIDLLTPPTAELKATTDINALRPGPR